MKNDKRLAKINPGLLALMHGNDSALMPFAREIRLAECNIAGTCYQTLKDIEPTLEPGALLVLHREPDNAHDPLAIRIQDKAGHDIGYVPRVRNEAIARLMDAGKALFGRLESKEWVGDWLKAEVHIFMKDF